MMLRPDMEELVELLDALDGVTATIDPRKAANNRPCLLVVPPTIEAAGTLAGPLYRHRVVALSSKSTGGLDGLDELDALLTVVWPALPFETATPSTYQLGNDRIPCYVLTLNNT